SFTVAAADGSTTTVTINIKGTNDAPVLSTIAPPPAVIELSNASAQDLVPILGTVSVTDRDIGNTLTASISGTPTLVWSGGTLTEPQLTALTAALVTDRLTFTGTATSDGGAKTIGYSYDAAAANVDFLRAGDTLKVTYAVTVSDGTVASGTQNLVFTI